MSAPPSWSTSNVSSDPGTVELMRRIKTALDPHDVLNPGKKIPAASVLGFERGEQRGRVVGLVDPPRELAPVIDGSSIEAS